MSFFGFLLLVLLFIILKPLIRVIWTVWKAMRQVKNMNADASRQQSHRPGNNRPRRKKKIFQRDEGEYVDFEEIEVTETRSTDTAGNRRYTGSRPADSRVTDAEWEDIP